MKKIISLLIIVATITMIVASCNKGLDRINQDNNNYPKDVLPKNELPQVILNTAESITGADLAWYTSVYIEHSVGVSNQLYSADLRQSIGQPSLINNSWNSLYSSSLVTGMDMIKKTKGTNDGYMEAVARILVAYNLGLAVDLWGDVPFTEAFNIKILQPKYDKASDLYDTVINYLNEAVRLLNLPNQLALPTTEDYIYNGTATKWEKAAHSLLARYYLRLGSIRTDYYQNALNEVNKGFQSADDAMVFTKFTDNQGEWNPWNDFLQQRDYLATSNTLYNIMSPNDTTRKKALFTIPNGTKCLDNPVLNDLFYAYLNGYCVSNYSLSGASPMPFMTYHELLFIKAESEQRLGQNALQSLKDAITANFIWNGNTATQAALYTGTITTADISTILKEKYIAQYPSEAIEAYNDYRRTKGESVVVMNNPRNNNTTTGGFPNFFPYPLSEVSNNPANVPPRSVTLTKPIWAK